jgi:ATP-dependent exoDNAse (exonuclease V) alpha subunit
MNEKQLEALNIVKNRSNLFLTGAAGTGKSYTIKAIINYLESININYGLTAMTGCAAVLIGGQTIHSFLYMNISRNLNEIYSNLEKFRGYLNKLKKLDVLIIDEISMMDDELFELINNLLMKIKNNNLLFGGVQLILVGDFYQLPPINGDFCFTSNIWNLLDLKKIILTDIIRQKDDMTLQEILREIREGNISKNTFELLETLKDTKFKNKDIKPTKLYPININVDKINNNEFKKLLKLNNNNSIEYKASKINPKHKITDEKLNEYNITLTLNAQIMVIRNISIENKLYNGTRGIVIGLNTSSVIIKDINNNIHTINYYIDNIKDKSIKFMPLKLAYAISIHKSQGASIDYLELDLGDDIFISGQLYTALSRATNINNIKIVNLSKLSFMQNKKVIEFYS